MFKLPVLLYPTLSKTIEFLQCDNKGHTATWTNNNTHQEYFLIGYQEKKKSFH